MARPAPSTSPTPSLEEAWHALSDRLRAFIRSRVSDPADADDVLQETFVKAHAALPGVRDSGRLASWLFQIARNAIADHYRAKRRPVAALIDATEDADADEAERDLAGCISAIAETLPETDQQALRFVDVDGWSQKTLARELGISFSGAKSRVQRARARLKSTLLECCHVELDRRGGVVDFALKDPDGPHCEHCAGR